MTWETEQMELMRRLDALDKKDQTWVWDAATLLHHEHNKPTAEAFRLAFSCLPEAIQPCEACNRSATFPRDHAFDCPLASLDEPAYAVHCLMTEPPEDLSYSDPTAGLHHP